MEIHGAAKRRSSSVYIRHSYAGGGITNKGTAASSELHRQRISSSAISCSLCETTPFAQCAAAPKISGDTAHRSSSATPP